MTNRAHIQIHTTGTNICFVSDYPYGIMSDFGEKIKAYLSEVVTAAEGLEPAQYHSVDDVVKWFMQFGLTFSETCNMGKVYWYKIDIKPECRGIDLRYCSRWLDNWDESDFALSNRLLTSDPILSTP